MIAATHFWRIRARLAERFGLPCRVISRGRMNSVLNEFDDGTRHVVSRNAIRRLP